MLNAKNSSGKSRASKSRAIKSKRPFGKVPELCMSIVDKWLSNRWIAPICALLFLCLVVLLVGPSFRKKANISAKLIVGSRDHSVVKATRAFTYVPSEQQRNIDRQNAERSVKPVFDHRAVLAEIVERVDQAFESASRALEQKSHSASGKKKRGERSVAKVFDQFANDLRADLPKSTFKALSSTKFGTSTNSAIKALVRSVVRENLIVAHRGELAQFQGQAITLLRHDEQGNIRSEETISNLGRIRDVDEAKGRVIYQAKLVLPRMPERIKKAVISVAQSVIAPTIAYNEAETSRRKSQAIKGIDAAVLTFVPGQVIVPDGAEISDEDVRKVQEMERVSVGNNRIAEILGISGLLLLLIGGICWFSAKEAFRFKLRGRDWFLLAILVVGCTLAIKGFAQFKVRDGRTGISYVEHLVPIAAGAMLVRLLLRGDVAFTFAVIVSLIAGLMQENQISFVLIYLIPSVVGAYALRRVQSRGTMWRAGLLAGLAAAFTSISVHLYAGQTDVAIWGQWALAAFGSGILSSCLILALLPMLEWLFSYTTDVSLLELANLNHPLLRDLMLRAPGTYHHSLVVGSLSEAACEAIGANGLLARVASNYHDVGKMKNAAYFAENTHSNEKPHDRLKPSMSALIIRSHVKDGIEMMKAHGIPPLVVETASQHHGTALIAYFYHKSVEQSENGEDVLEDDYRYPGPKPQSREAGIIMLADGIEAAARSMADPGIDKLRSLVQHIISSRFADGQLDHCALTLRDLNIIAENFLKILSGIYHARPTYPWQDKKEKPERSTGKRSPGNGVEQEKLKVSDSAKVEKMGETQPDSKRDNKKRESGSAPTQGSPKGVGERSLTSKQSETVSQNGAHQNGPRRTSRRRGSSDRVSRPSIEIEVADPRKKHPTRPAVK